MGGVSKSELGWHPANLLALTNKVTERLFPRVAIARNALVIRFDGNVPLAGLLVREHLDPATYDLSYFLRRCLRSFSHTSRLAEAKRSNRPGALTSEL